jgi:hypothetical protein
MVQRRKPRRAPPALGRERRLPGFGSANLRKRSREPGGVDCCRTPHSSIVRSTVISPADGRLHSHPIALCIVAVHRRAAASEPARVAAPATPVRSSSMPMPPRGHQPSSAAMPARADPSRRDARRRRAGCPDSSVPFTAHATVRSLQDLWWSDESAGVISQLLDETQLLPAAI